MRPNWQLINGTSNGIAPLPAIKSEYEASLERMVTIELLQEYEVATLDWAQAKQLPLSIERVRLCRRELARRLFARPNNAA